jgi:hypothetical protein
LQTRTFEKCEIAKNYKTSAQGCIVEPFAHGTGVVVTKFIGASGMDFVNASEIDSTEG